MQLKEFVAYYRLVWYQLPTKNMFFAEDHVIVWDRWVAVHMGTNYAPRSDSPVLLYVPERVVITSLVGVDVSVVKSSFTNCLSTH